MTLGAMLLVAIVALAGAIAGLVLAAVVLDRGGGRSSAAWYGIGWTLLVCVPLAWNVFGGQGSWSPFPEGAYDFAGAIPFHVAGGIGALAVSVLIPPNAAPAT